jgi:hypothetical protein
LEAVVIQTELLQKTVKFTELCTAPNGLMNGVFGGEAT